MSISEINLIRHILDEINYLILTSNDLEYEELIKNPTLQKAFVRSLEIVGEATKKLPPEFRNSNPKIEWRSMAAMRDRLIHNYFDVDYHIVWDVIKNHLPDLKMKLEKLT